MNRALRIPSLRAALAASSLALIAGCAGDDPLGPFPLRPPVRIAEGVFVIAGASREIGLHDIGEKALILDYAGGPLPAPGDVIVGEERGGYIRRARTVERTGDRVVVSTMPAYLTCAVVTGWVDTSFAAGFSSSDERTVAAAPEAAGLRLDGIELLPAGAGPAGSSILIERGRIEFDPAVAVRLAIFGGRMTSLAVEVAGPLALDLGLSARIGGPLSWTGRTTVATVRRPITARIGPVPVPITLTTSILVETSVSARSAGDCAWEYAASHEVDAGMRLERSWHGSPVFSGTPCGSPAITRSDGADCRIDIAVVCETEVSLFAAETEPGLLRFEASPAERLDVVAAEWPWWSWTLEGAMALECRASAGALDPLAPPPASFAAGDTILIGSGPFRTDSYIFVDEWDGGADPLARPLGLALGPGGRLYVCDQGDHRIVVLGPDGDVESSWGGYGSAEGRFAFPAGVAVDREGNVYVCDSGNHRVQQFTSGGVFTAAWGTEGTGAGQFIQPEGIAANSDTLLAVCDGGTGAVVLLGTSGNEIARWDNSLSRGVAFDAASDLFVAGCPASSVTKYSVSGELLDRWESDGAGLPRFDCPIDIAVGPAGTVLVLEYGACRFTAISPDGTTLSRLGARGSAPGRFDSPGGIAVSAAGWVYVADTFNGRVQVFAPRSMDGRAIRRTNR